MQLTAFLAGINRYADPGINRLTCAVRDTLALELCLQHQCGFKTRSLTDEQATKQAIKDGVRTMCAGLGRGDLFLFYFSGHGSDEDHSSQQVLHPVNVSLADLDEHDASDLIPVRWLEEATAKCGATRVFVFDACRVPLRAGTKDAAAAQGEAGVRDITTLVQRDAAENPPLVVLCSCSPGQRAHELANLGRGAFSQAFEDLLRAHLQSRRRLVFPGTVLAELSEATGHLLQAHGRQGRQDPLLRFNRGEVVLLEGRDQPPTGATVKCPVCGKRNAEADTFECQRCRKDHLCNRHFVEARECCHVCAGKLDQEDEAEAARQADAQRQREEAERQAKAEAARKQREAEAEAARQAELQRQEEEARQAARRREQERSNPANATKDQPWENSLGMKFVPVLGTEVLFGIWEVRVQDYRAYAKANPGVDGSWEKPYFQQTDTHPVVNVSWEDAQAFCAWLTKKEQAEGKLTASQSYRLPQDWEWSVAVGLNEPKAGTPQDKDMKIKDVYPWGTQWPPPKRAGNYAASLGVDDFDYTSPVGSFAANRYGLYDLGGNVWEWCEDWYDGEQKFRVLRGASWYCVPGYLLSSCRYSCTPDYRRNSIGFRVVLVGGLSR